jgi:hypothetical protein
LKGPARLAVGGLAGSDSGCCGQLLLEALLPGNNLLGVRCQLCLVQWMLGGGAAEAAVSAYTGKPPTGQAGTEIPQPPRFIDTPLGRINLNASASMEDAMNRNQKRQLDYTATVMGMETSQHERLDAKCNGSRNSRTKVHASDYN